jgi:hypothetical protein
MLLNLILTWQIFYGLGLIKGRIKAYPLLGKEHIGPICYRLGPRRSSGMWRHITPKHLSLVGNDQQCWTRKMCPQNLDHPTWINLHQHHCPAPLAYTSNIAQPQLAYIKHNAKTQSTYSNNTIEIQSTSSTNTTKTQPTFIIPAPHILCEAKFPSSQERNMDKPIFGKNNGCCWTKDPLIMEGKLPLVYTFHFPFWSPKW